MFSFKTDHFVCFDIHNWLIAILHACSTALSQIMTCSWGGVKKPKQTKKNPTELLSITDVLTAVKSLWGPGYSFKHCTLSKSMALIARHQQPLGESIHISPTKAHRFQTHTHTYHIHMTATTEVVADDWLCPLNCVVPSGWRVHCNRQVLKQPAFNGPLIHCLVFSINTAFCLE